MTINELPGDREQRTVNVTASPASLSFTADDWSAPTAAVTINDPVDTEVTASPASLTFTADDWSTAQTVTVEAAQDADALDETATVTHSVSSSDAATRAR